MSEKGRAKSESYRSSTEMSSVNDISARTISSQVELTGKFREDDTYDPYEHRQVAHPLSNTETLIHLLKSSLGTGILAMPKAIYHAGYVLGSIGTIIIGLICVYCIQMLLKSHYELCRRRKIPSMDYPSIVKHALLEGPKPFRKFACFMEHLTTGLLILYQVGSCCIYVVFISENIKAISDDYTQPNEIDIRLVMLIILLPLILINWVRNLKYLAPFSTLANIITVISFGIIFYFIFRDPISVEGKEGLGGNIPSFIGTVLFSLESIGLVMPLENEMRTPRSYGGKTGVLNRGFSIIVALYLTMGVFGYLRYGAQIEDTITLNLYNLKDPNVPNIDRILAHSVRGMLAFGIFITHGIACYVAIELTWNAYIVKRITNERRKLIWEYVLRTMMVMITFILAEANPKLGAYISLFGALCLSLLGLAFPALIESLVFRRQKTGKAKNLMIAKNSVIIIFGLFALVIGTITSLNEIFK